MNTLSTILFILLWLSMGETAYTKMKGETWVQRTLLYIFAPFIHFSVLLINGTKGYFCNDWEKLY